MTNEPTTDSLKLALAPAAQTATPWRKLALVVLSPLMVALAMLFIGSYLPAPSSPWAQAEDAQEEAKRLREISVADASVATSVEQEAMNSGPMAVSKEVPAEPLPGQRRGPCRAREVEIRGGCWDRLGDHTPPCEDDRYEWEGGCYVPKFTQGRAPTSDKKKQ